MEMKLIMSNAKLLGVPISSALTRNKHVENIVAKAGKRVYMLYQLKRAGIGHHYLAISVMRPVSEYTCPVWHTNLNRHLTESIETVQKRALKCIYPGNEYADMLCLTNRHFICKNIITNEIYTRCMDHVASHFYCLFILYDLYICTVYVNPTRWGCK